jgi:predicted O-methyltransferase YrrM
MGQTAMDEREVVDILTLVETVEGWLTPKEGRLLYDLARRASGRGAIVEIGSWKGKSTIWLARGSRRGAGRPVYAVDPHTGSSEHRAHYGAVDTVKEFTDNLRRAGVEAGVIPRVMTSEEAAKTFAEPVELIFIDGGHEYELIKRDFDLWFPRVVDGGLMAFHDTALHRGAGWPGPKRLVEEHVYRSTRFRNVRFVDSITVGEKVAANTAGDRLRNRRALAFKLAGETGSRLRVPTPLRRAGRKLLERLS